MEEKKKTRIGLGIVIGVLIGLFVGMVGTFCFFLLSGRMVTSADPTKVAGVAPEEEDTSAISEAVIMKMKLVEEIFDRYYLEEDLDKS